MRRSRGLRDYTWWALRIINVSLLFMIAGVFGLVLGTYSGIAALIPRARDLGDIRPGLQSRVLSADGQLLYTVATEHREFVQLERIPRALQDAVISVEDREFYHHVGIDPRAIMRAAIADIIARAPRQGGSTITQQLARNVYLTPSRTLSRKLAEAILAVQLERAYTKPEILELYLNQIYFGEGAYGAQVAANTYFGKDVSDLDVAECALLAGLAKAPGHYSPFKHEERAVDRRNLVLTMMADQGCLTQEEARAGREAPLKLVEDRKPLSLGSPRAPYFTNYIMREVVARYGPDALYKGGLTIHTTLNLQMQEAAEEAIAWGMQNAKRRKFQVDQMALVALDVRTGAIKAMVGGLDYSQKQFNIAVQGARQAGSAFKPFVYTAAFEQGYTADSIIEDSPVSYPAEPGEMWAPDNYDGEFHGQVTFREALAHSYNVAAVKVADLIGIGSVIATAERMGIYRGMQEYLPLAIGYSNVTPLEMASAYAVFGTGGMRAEPFGIRKIEDAKGRSLEKHQVISWRALNAQVAEQMVDMLTEVIRSGTGAAQSYLLRRFPVAGKTGTSSEYRDAWFIGFTSDLSAAVWVGNEEFKSTSPSRSRRGVSGATLPAPIWARFILKAQPLMAAERAQAEPPRVIEIDPSEQGSPEAPQPPDALQTGDAGQAGGGEGTATPQTITKRVCPVSGGIAGPHCPNPAVVTYNVASGEGPPDQKCDLHTTAAAGQPPPPEPQPAPAEPPATTARDTLPICAITGQIASPRCPIVVNRTFQADAAPAETCTRHGRSAPGR
jgi:penicillin-binding protein 1A